MTDTREARPIEGQLADIRYVAEQRAATEAAVAREYAETMAEFEARAGAPFPQSWPFTREHVRLLIRSAFLAGCVWEANRRAALKTSLNEGSHDV